MRRLGLPVLAALICAASDTRLTWADTSWLPAGFDLPLQTLLGWLALALLMAWPAAWLGRRLGAAFTAALLLTAAPVVLHQSVRMPLRRSGFSAETFGALGLELGLLLLVGIALRFGERALARRGRAGLAGLLLFVLAVAAGLPMLGNPSRSPALAASAVLPERHAAPANRPNLMLLVWDTTRASELGAYGNPHGLTPHLDALAAAGAVYEQAWSSSVFTLSSHASMLSGLPPSLHGTGMRQQRVRVPTLATRLKQLGYRTGAFVGTSVLRGGLGLEQDFDVYDDQVDPALCDTRLWSLVHDLQVFVAALVPALRGNGLPHGFQDFQRPGDQVLDAALDFVRRDDPRPWFVFVNLFDVHWPYLPGDESRQRFVADYDGPLGGYLFRADNYPDDYTPTDADKSHLHDLYEAEMWELDQAVDGFLKGLELDRGDVRLILTGDHGEGFGEADRWSHEHLHGPQTRVPLVIYAPGLVAPNTRIAAPAAGYDVAPTLLALAGMPPEARAQLNMVGRSLLDSGDARDVFIQDFDNLDDALDGHAVIRGRFKLLDKPGARTLHDVHDDPLDLIDLSAEHPELLAEMSAALDKLLEATVESGDGQLDNADALRALGYTDLGTSDRDR